MKNKLRIMASFRMFLGSKSSAHELIWVEKCSLRARPPIILYTRVCKIQYFNHAWSHVRTSLGFLKLLLQTFMVRTRNVFHSAAASWRETWRRGHGHFTTRCLTPSQHTMPNSTVMSQAQHVTGVVTHQSFMAPGGSNMLTRACY